MALVKDFDAFLRPEYGEYMQMPPEDERHNHYASFIDFGDGEPAIEKNMKNDYKAEKIIMKQKHTLEFLGSNVLFGMQWLLTIWW